MITINYKSFESIYQDSCKFISEHKLFAILIGILFMCLIIWNVYTFHVSNGQKILNDKIGELVEERDKLNTNLANKDREILRLESQLTPFKTVALEKFANDDEAGLNKLLERFNVLDKNLQQFKSYNTYALYTMIGMRDSYGVITGTELAVLIQPALQINTIVLPDDPNITTVSVKNTPETEGILKKVIAKYPGFPFAYYFMSQYLHNKNDASWINWAKKAEEILLYTTSLEEHNYDHDVALKNLQKDISLTNQ